MAAEAGAELGDLDVLTYDVSVELLCCLLVAWWPFFVTHSVSFWDLLAWPSKQLQL